MTFDSTAQMLCHIQYMFTHHIHKKKIKAKKKTELETNIITINENILFIPLIVIHNYNS